MLGTGNGLSLENLAMPKGFYDPEALAAIPKMNFDGRCGSTDEETAALHPDYDAGMKDINECIYGAGIVCGSGTGIPGMRRRQLERMKALFGFSDDDECYAWIDAHDAGDPDAGELLVADAVRTGRWKELPDELQAEYHARKGAAT